MCRLSHSHWLLLTTLAAALAGCGPRSAQDTVRSEHSRLGAKLIAENCGACHVVPSIAVAKGRVGPSLADIAGQQLIAGHFANTPGNMTRWIEHPQQMLPGNAMPEMGLTHEQAATIADYLYSMESRL